MPNQFPWDTVLNIVFFAVGFIIGLAQLWQAQRFFLADQRNKFEQISNAVTNIAQRLAVIEGVTNRLVEIDRTLSTIGATSTSVQERLFGIVERQFSIGDQTGQVTLEASDEIKELIKQQLPNSQFVTPDKMMELEEKLDRVLSELSTQVLSLVQASEKPKAEIVRQKDSIHREIAPASDNPEILVIGQLGLDKNQRKVWKGDRALTLAPRSFKVLELFMENPDTLITVKQIREEVFNDYESTIAHQAIATAIYRLRQEIDLGKSWLTTVRSREGPGYILSSRELATNGGQ